ncbi:MAG TPA: response regulator transcription factor [Candidatus Limnocylindrales bacterium]
MRVAIADDHAVVREGIRRMLEGSGFEVAVEAASGQELLDRLAEAEVDVALVDFAMPGGGIELVTRLHHARPSVRTLVFTVHPEEQYALRCLRAGAAGYLPKSSIPEVLIDALDVVAAGRTYIGPAVADLLAARVAARSLVPSHERLSPREFDVFLCLARGEGVVEIASRLRVSVKSISTYRARVLEKLALSRNAELTRYAVEHGLID